MFSPDECSCPPTVESNAAHEKRVLRARARIKYLNSIITKGSPQCGLDRRLIHQLPGCAGTHEAKQRPFPRSPEALVTFNSQRCDIRAGMAVCLGRQDKTIAVTRMLLQ